VTGFLPGCAKGANLRGLLDVERLVRAMGLAMTSDDTPVCLLRKSSKSRSAVPDPIS
jgi:hypothetical protein